MNFIKIFGYALGKSKLFPKTVSGVKNAPNPMLLADLTKGKMIFPYTRINNINSSKLSYIPQFQLGEVINSGLEAVVYDIKNYKNLVARVPKNKNFNPFNLRPINGDIRGVIASCKSGAVTVMKKFEGEPLHGKGWDIRKRPVQEIFESTLDKLNELPDSTFSQLIDDIINIRKKGFDIDNINPNNFLLDIKSKKINIVDISKNKTGEQGIKLNDIIEPLLDDRRIMYLDKINVSTKTKIKEFINRIISIGRSKNLYFAMEKPDYSKLQTSLVYLYHDDKDMINIIRRKIMSGK